MNPRGKWAVAAAGALVAAWAGLQLFLTHRLAADFRAKSLANCAGFLREHPTGTCQPIGPVSANDWLPYAVSSIVVLLALAGVAALLVRGGRRWWSLIVAALPAANFFYGWQDPRLLGAGWIQLTGNDLTRWLLTGVIVDTLVVTVIAATLAFAVRTVATPLPARQLLRVIPPMLVLAGWWTMRHPLPSQVDKIWLVQGLAFVLGTGLLVTSGLTLWTRTLGVLVLLPLCTLPIYSGAVGFGSFAGVGRRALFALGTAAMVVIVPRAIALLRPTATEQQRPAASVS